MGFASSSAWRRIRTVLPLLSIGVLAGVGLPLLIVEVPLAILLIGLHMWLNGALFPFLSIVTFDPASTAIEPSYFHQPVLLTALQWLAMVAVDLVIVEAGWVRRAWPAAFLVCGVTAALSIMFIVMSGARLDHFRI